MRQLLKEMSPDDQTRVLEELPPEVTKRILETLSPDELKSARDLLGYPVVWAAAGRPDAVFEIAPERLRELSSAVIADLKAESNRTSAPGLRAASPASGDS